jgi:plastocyanin
MQQRTAAIIGLIAIILGAASLALAAPLALRPQTPLTLLRGEKTIYMTAVEYKGSTTVDKLSPPETDPSTLGKAYGFKWLEPNTRWEVSAYAWSPSVVVVQQGDRVTLKIFGVNGDTHPSMIEGYNIAFTVTRGRLTEVSFVADKAGVFRIICTTHLPHMVGYLIVLPSS